MWFDPQRALAELQGGSLPHSDMPRPTPVLVPCAPLSRVAQVAHVARPQPQKPENLLSAGQGTDGFRHGISINGDPRTWTGRIVSLAAWRTLTEWERHGPDGRHWNGITRQWETPDNDAT